jgi:transposase
MGSSTALVPAEALLGGQWNHLPAEFGDDVSIHRTMQRWENRGVFDILWAVLLTKCELIQGVDWSRLELAVC